MPFAIGLKATGPTAERLTRLWTRFERFETKPSMRFLGYPPHVTLAIYEEIDEGRLREALSVFKGARALVLTFTAVRLFEAPQFVVWAEPAPSAALSRSHAAVHARIDPALCHEHYRPERWVPHATLATRIAPEREAEARAVAATPNEPFDVVFDIADCIEFPPIRAIDETGLQ